MRRELILLLAAVAICAASATTAPAADAVSVGDVAPDFVAKNVADKDVSLSDLRDKPVVLIFSRAHW